MAPCPDRRKLCLALLLTGTLLYVMFGVVLKTPRTDLNRWRATDDDDNLLFHWDDETTDYAVTQSESSSESTHNTEIWESFLAPKNLKDARKSSKDERESPNDSRESSKDPRKSPKDARKSPNEVRKKRLPDTIIIGVRKCGTRALLEFLKIHPSIRACVSEVHFFDDEINYNRGIDWYREQMPKSLPDHITMEKTPAYFVTDEVPKRIQAMSKNVKLIVIVRDPTERAISDYAQLLEKSNGMLPSFEKFVTSGKAQRELKTSRTAVRIGVYIRHLRNWLKYFPLSQLHFVSGEELTSHPAKELQAVEKFLNIEPFIKEEFFYLNTTKRFPCLSQGEDGEARRNSGCLAEGKGRPHPAIRDDIRQLLQDYYRPFNNQFYEAVGRDFNWS